MTTRRLARWSTLVGWLGAAGCAGFGNPTFVPPGEGYDVSFDVTDAKLRIRAISIDGQVACEPTAEGQGRPPCARGFETRLSPGRHYLQIQVTMPGETGHKDAEERIVFEAEGRYLCEVSERFVETHHTAVESVGFSEPTVACRVVTAAEAKDAEDDAPAPDAADEASDAADDEGVPESSAGGEDETAPPEDPSDASVLDAGAAPDEDSAPTEAPATSPG